MKNYRNFVKTILSILLPVLLGVLALWVFFGREPATAMRPGSFSDAAVDFQDVLLFNDQAEFPDWLEDQEFWVVRAYFDDLAMVRRLSSILEPWEVNTDEGYLVVDVTPVEYDMLISMGFRVEIDAALTEQYSQPLRILPSDADAIPVYSCYRTVEETYAAAEQIVLDHSDLAEWVDVGDSWEKVTPDGNPGYDMMVLKLTNGAVPGPKPKIFIMSSVHAREYTPAELNTRFAEYLVNGYGKDPDVTWLLDEHEFHLMLMANPDGRKKAEAGMLWRKNTNSNYCSTSSSYYGADLNRNFEFQWACCEGSSDDECAITYHGPEAASEPETQAIQAYVRSQFPDQRGEELEVAAPSDATGVFLDIHSYSELVLWPWSFTEDNTTPNGAALDVLGRKLAYINHYDPSHQIWYLADGTTTDFAYGDLGLAAFTFELGTTFFQDCATFENTILPDNIPALIYAAKVARTPYLTPSGPDVIDPALSQSMVAVGDVVTLTASINDDRITYDSGVYVQDIAGAEYYIDIPPWKDGAVPMPMDALDGAFDEWSETAQAVIDTTGLATGRHMLYLRGLDANGNWGAVSSVFLNVYDPVLAPTLEGYVLEAYSNKPVTATIVIDGALSLAADLETGFYSTRIFSGTHSVTASAEGYGSQTVEGIVAQDMEVVRQDFALYPFCTVLEEDAESTALGWAVEEPWLITDIDAASGTYSWYARAGSDQREGWNASLTSPALQCTGQHFTLLSFSHICDLELFSDICVVEVSADGGSTWESVMEFNGEQTEWELVTIPLPMLDDQPEVQIRFRFSTGRKTLGLGWFVDDIYLRNSGGLCLDGFVAPVNQVFIPIVTGE